MPNSEPLPSCWPPSMSRPNVPNVMVALLPFSSRGVFEMKLTTPFMALAPHTADAGPADHFDLLAAHSD